MKLRKVHPFDVAMIESLDAKLRFIVQDLRLVGASRAADAVARARKSVDGARRHAQRCVDASKA